MKLWSARISLFLCVLLGTLMSLPFELATAQTETKVIKRKRSNPKSKTRKKRPVVETRGRTVDKKKTEDFSKPSGTGLSAFLGLDSGYVNSTPTDKSRESKKTGYHLGFKGLASLFTNSMVVDVGGGYLISNLEGDKDTLESGDTTTEISDVAIETRIGYFEFSPRVRIGRTFSLGLLGQAFFGEDGRFGPEDPLDDPNAEQTATNLATAFGGVSAVMEWMGESVGGRVGVQAMTDVNIAERQLMIVQLSLQVGIPIIRQKTIVERKRTHTVREKIRRKEVERVVEEVVVKEIVKFQFDSQFINFETDKARLSQKSKEFLFEVAQFLLDNPTIWGNVIVDGHTDVRGSFEYNMNLSRNRAASVREHLVASGIPPERIKSAGYGFTKPIDERNIPVAWARNRRVEMTFSKVTDPVLLRQGIERIRSKMKLNSR